MVFPRRLAGRRSGSEMLWFERETLTLLNPGDEEAKVTLTFFSYGCPADVELWVPPHGSRSCRSMTSRGSAFAGWRSGKPG